MSSPSTSTVLRLPGRTGQFLALTGARIDGAECAALGLATHYVAAERLPELKAALIAEPDRVSGILDAFAETPPPARIVDNRATIDRLRLELGQSRSRSV